MSRTSPRSGSFNSRDRRSGSFNSHDDSYSYENDTEGEAPRESRAPRKVKHQQRKKSTTGEIPRESRTPRKAKLHEKAPRKVKRHERRSSTKGETLRGRKHSKEVEENQITNRESSDSVSYVTRKELQHLERAVNALWDRVEKVEKKERDSHDSVASGGSAYPIVSMPPKAPPNVLL